MKITAFEVLHADGGGRAFDFLKISTDEGIVGWSEFNESFGGLGVTQVIERLSPVLIGKDPRAIEAHVALMQALRRVAAGGVNQQAIGAIENALVDIKAKALGIPVYELLGGPIRQQIRLYWSHCGSYRVGGRAEMLGVKPVKTLDDIVELGKEVVASGYTGLKTNVVLLDNNNPRGHVPGFARGEGFPELNADRKVMNAIKDQLAAFRQGTGPDMDILVDLNFNYKTEGYLKMARAMEEFDLFWLEMDMRYPEGMRYVRESTSIPIASCETLYGRREFRSYFENGSMDVAIIDVPYNGILESHKIAWMADAYEVNVAPHNFYSPLATTISAHFASAVPNLRIMEIDPDVVPWYHELVTNPIKIENGHLMLPSGPG
ncbi:MAG: mandelate racemase/muconate lactonizing enzyme family protein, partial [Chloroflexota bacterium]